MRKQVSSELKVRRYVFYTLILLSLLYIAGNLLFSETGLLRYMELKERRFALGKQISIAMEETSRLSTSIKAFKENDFYVEKHAREEFGLAGPDEYIFIYK